MSTTSSPSSGMEPAGSGSAVMGSRQLARRNQRRNSFKEKVRVTVRTFGEIFITLGLVLLLFCGYQLWWTDVLSARASAKLLDEFDQQLAAAPVSNAIEPVGDLEAGEVFGAMYVPRFGDSWVRPVLEGVELSDLHRGIGHYTGSALPGEKGNFSLAGHRTTNGHPFKEIDKLDPGDQIFIETRTAWYTYDVEVPRKIVKPTDVYVVQPVPEEGAHNEEPERRLLTLTSCHPMYSAKERIIIHAVQTDVRPRSEGPPPGAPSAAFE